MRDLPRRFDMRSVQRKPIFRLALRVSCNYCIHELAQKFFSLAAGICLLWCFRSLIGFPIKRYPQRNFTCLLSKWITPQVRLQILCTRHAEIQLNYQGFLDSTDEVLMVLQLLLKFLITMYHMCEYIKNKNIMIVLTWCFQCHRLTIGSGTYFSVRSNRHIVLGTKKQIIQDNKCCCCT